jgi:translation initiation factor IF-2
VTITEGITIRELAEKLDVRAKDLLKTLLDKGVFASINQALDVPTATSLAALSTAGAVPPARSAR